MKPCLEEFVFAYRKPNTSGVVIVSSRVYNDFGECYDDYCEHMQDLIDEGHDLSAIQWRGVFTEHEFQRIRRSAFTYPA